jgi:hypothetical protein
MTSDEALVNLELSYIRKICPLCRVGTLKPHPEASKIAFKEIVKCETCGYSALVKPLDEGSELPVEK